MTVIGSEFQTSSEGMLHKSRRPVWLTQCSGGRSQITAMLLILDEARKVRRRRRVADLERQQSLCSQLSAERAASTASSATGWHGIVLAPGERSELHCFALL